MSAAETIQLIRDKWNEIGQDEQLSRAFVTEARSHIGDGGGVLWIKYDSRDPSAQPKWTFVPRGSELWNQIPRFITNFTELTRDYNPEKHCLLFLSVPHGVESMYGQMTRVNYERDEDTAISTSQPQENDDTWTFRLT